MLLLSPDLEVIIAQGMRWAPVLLDTTARVPIGAVMEVSEVQGVLMANGSQGILDSTGDRKDSIGHPGIKR